MMKNPKNGNEQADIVAGKVFPGKKWKYNEKTKQGQWERAKFFNIALYEVDENDNLIVKGEITLKNGDKAPKYNIVRTFRIAESSLLKVASGDSKSCNLYYRKRN